MGSSDDAIAADALGVASSGVGFHAHPSPHALKRIVLVRTVALEHRSAERFSAERRHVAWSFNERTDDRLVCWDPFDGFFSVLV